MPSKGAPVFFRRNRVSRVYRGGLLFHGFFGDAAEDGLHPEEWVASTVRALNRDSGDPLEGISRLEGTGMPFTQYLAARPEALDGRPDLGILVKLLDSAIRLPVQAHPDKAFARTHFASAHGKTEMWLVLATRADARIYFGFREPVTEARFAAAVEASERDPGAMPALLNEVPVHPGDAWLIPARVVHAIGSGCLILEVQEPTDFTIQPEAWCGDYRLDEREMYIGLDRATALSCFDFQDLVGEKALRRGRLAPSETERAGALTVERIVGEPDTSDFTVNRLRVRRGGTPPRRGPAVYVVTDGEGEVAWPDGRRALCRGACFFLPADACRVTFASGASLDLVECLPPKG